MPADVFTPSAKVFLHGAGGAGMRGLGWLIAQRGTTVVGFDDDPVSTQALPEGITVVQKEEVEREISSADVYICSDAVPPEHPFRKHAMQEGKQILPYQKALGLFANNYTLIAVTGTHGKSSTTAFLAHILRETGMDPTALVGAEVPGWAGKNALFGKSNLCVVEADEYRNHFHELSPTHVIIPSIEYDHPDFFEDEAAVLNSYQTFINSVPPGGHIVVPNSLKGINLVWPNSTMFIEAEDSLAAPLPGAHMKMNAMLAVTLAQNLGVAKDEAIATLQSFPGLGRRFEILGALNRAAIISDYAHHPTEVAAVIAAAREKYPDTHLTVVFEAHMAERLESFHSEFARALSHADSVIMYPPYLPTGRTGTRALELRDILAKELEAKGTPTAVLQTAEELDPVIKKASVQQQIIMACTAGRLDSHLRELLH